MQREWAKGLRYRNSGAGNWALPHCLHRYHERRPTQHPTAGYRSAALTTSPGRTTGWRRTQRLA
jgi:hypothetical protein